MSKILNSKDISKIWYLKYFVFFRWIQRWVITFWWLRICFNIWNNVKSEHSVCYCLKDVLVTGEYFENFKQEKSFENTFSGNESESFLVQSDRLYK